SPPRDGDATLVGWWPFDGSLADRAGGHDAGLVGNAALARAGVTVHRFTREPRFRRGDGRRPAAPATFIAHMSRLKRGPRVDGSCGAAEYPGGGGLRLGLRAAASLRTALGPRGLYACTSCMAGGPRSSAPLRLLPDGP